MPVLLDYLRLWIIVRNVQLTANSPDVLLWRWPASMSYSSSSAYHALFVGASRPLGAKELWKVFAPAKVKHFFWLALHRKCWTAARRHRHGLQQSPNYVLCSTGVEEIDHILLSCAFSQQVWHTVLGVLGLVQAVFTAADSFWSWWLRSCKLVSKDLRRGFDSLVFLVGWHLYGKKETQGLSTTPAAARVRSFERSSMKQISGLWQVSGICAAYRS